MGIVERLLRRFGGLRTLHVAKEFSSDEELKRYLQDHKKADPKKHWIKGQKPKQQTQEPKPATPAPASKEPSPKGKAPKEKPKTPRKRKGPETAQPSEPPKAEKKVKSKHPLEGNFTVELRENIGPDDDYYSVLRAKVLTVTDGSGETHQGVWKTQKAELEADKRRGKPLRAAIPAGTYYQREGLSSDFDGIFGGERVVPHTYEREIENEDGEMEMGSLQEFEPAMSYEDMIYGLYEHVGSAKESAQLDAKVGSSFQAKKMFFMDIISGNDDRHSGNSLWKTDEKYGYVPIAIDNGLTFPEGENIRFMFAIGEASAFAEAVVKPDEEIRKCLKDLDMQEMLDAMKRRPGVSKTAQTWTLVRIQALKNNPDLMAQELAKADADSNTYEKAVEYWINKDGSARVEDKEITQEQYDAIKKMVG